MHAGPVHTRPDAPADPGRGPRTERVRVTREATQAAGDTCGDGSAPKARRGPTPGQGPRGWTAGVPRCARGLSRRRVPAQASEPCLPRRQGGPAPRPRCVRRGRRGRRGAPPPPPHHRPHTHPAPQPYKPPEGDTRAGDCAGRRPSLQPPGSVSLPPRPQTLPPLGLGENSVRPRCGAPPHVLAPRRVQDAHTAGSLGQGPRGAAGGTAGLAWAGRRTGVPVPSRLRELTWPPSGSGLRGSSRWRCRSLTQPWP